MICIYWMMPFPSFFNFSYRLLHINVRQSHTELTNLNALTLESFKI